MAEGWQFEKLLKLFRKDYEGNVRPELAKRTAGASYEIRGGVGMVG